MQMTSRIRVLQWWQLRLPILMFICLMSRLSTSLIIGVPCSTTSPLFFSTTNISSEEATTKLVHSEFDQAVLTRYSCKKFQRYDGAESGTVITASPSDPVVIQQALHCLDLARRTPTAFNTQPYRVVLVHSPEQKLALSRFGLGPNAARIRDSDCTAIFLADRQILRSWSRFQRFLDETQHAGRAPSSRLPLSTMKFYIALFSSGYPLPRFLSTSLSFVVRTVVAFVNLVTRRFYPLPSLANCETWSSKQATMVAAVYMLGCASLGLATIPMEGIDAQGIRKVIGAPSRYAIPLIVSTGRAYTKTEDERKTQSVFTARYPIEEMVFDDLFGKSLDAKSLVSITTTM